MIRVLGFFVVFILCMIGYAPGFEQLYKNIAYSVRENEPVLVPLGFLLGLSVLLALNFFAKSLIARIVVSLITLGVCANELSYQLISGTGFGFNEANVVLREVEMAGSAFSTFQNEIMISFGVATLTTIILFMYSQFLPKIPTFIAILPVLVASVGYMAVAKGGHNVTYFPVTLRAPLNVYKAYTSPLYYGERDNVVLHSDPEQRAPHIIYIMDESVRGDKFSINGYNKQTTPYLESIGDKLINYGVASSGANCSATSNILAISGVQANQLPDTEHRTFKNPNIFQYAKAAGYKTYYLDGQTNRADYLNYMTKYDVKYIDHYAQTRKEQPNIEMHALDTAVADYIAKWVSENAANQQPSFIYALKNGAHFHYEDGYPASEKHFTPTLDKGSWNHDRIQTENSYANVIRWSVDVFFKRLLSKLDGQNVVIIYTADHGQGLMEDGNPSTHCMVGKPPATQGNVPLFLTGVGASFEKAKALLQPNVSANFGRVGHFPLFSTTLIFMGYEQSELADRYGESLIDNVQQPQVFFSGDLWGRAHLDRNPFSY